MPTANEQLTPIALAISFLVIAVSVVLFWKRRFFENTLIHWLTGLTEKAAPPLTKKTSVQEESPEEGARRLGGVATTSAASSEAVPSAQRSVRGGLDDAGMFKLASSSSSSATAQMYNPFRNGSSSQDSQDGDALLIVIGNTPATPRRSVESLIKGFKHLGFTVCEVIAPATPVTSRSLAQALRLLLLSERRWSSVVMYISSYVVKDALQGLTLLPDDFELHMNHQRPATASPDSANQQVSLSLLLRRVLQCVSTEAPISVLCDFLHSTENDAAAFAESPGSFLRSLSLNVASSMAFAVVSQSKVTLAAASRNQEKLAAVDSALAVSRKAAHSLSVDVLTPLFLADVLVDVAVARPTTNNALDLPVLPAGGSLLLDCSAFHCGVLTVQSVVQRFRSFSLASDDVQQPRPATFWSAGTTLLPPAIHVSTMAIAPRCYIAPSAHTWHVTARRSNILVETLLATVEHPMRGGIVAVTGAGRTDVLRRAIWHLDLLHTFEDGVFYLDCRTLSASAAISPVCAFVERLVANHTGDTAAAFACENDAICMFVDMFAATNALLVLDHVPSRSLDALFDALQQLSANAPSQTRRSRITIVVAATLHPLDPAMTTTIIELPPLLLHEIALPHQIGVGAILAARAGLTEPIAVPDNLLRNGSLAIAAHFHAAATRGVPLGPISLDFSWVESSATAAIAAAFFQPAAQEVLTIVSKLQALLGRAPGVTLVRFVASAARQMLKVGTYNYFVLDPCLLAPLSMEGLLASTFIGRNLAVEVAPYVERCVVGGSFDKPQTAWDAAADVPAFVLSEALRGASLLHPTSAPPSHDDVTTWPTALLETADFFEITFDAWSDPGLDSLLRSHATFGTVMTTVGVTGMVTRLKGRAARQPGTAAAKACLFISNVLHNARDVLRVAPWEWSQHIALANDGGVDCQELVRENVALQSIASFENGDEDRLSFAIRALRQPFSVARAGATVTAMEYFAAEVVLGWSDGAMTAHLLSADTLQHRSIPGKHPGPVATIFGRVSVLRDATGSISEKRELVSGCREPRSIFVHDQTLNEFRALAPTEVLSRAPGIHAALASRLQVRLVADVFDSSKRVHRLIGVDSRAASASLLLQGDSDTGRQLLNGTSHMQAVLLRDVRPPPPGAVPADDPIDALALRNPRHWNLCWDDRMDQLCTASFTWSNSGATEAAACCCCLGIADGDSPATTRLAVAFGDGHIEQFLVGLLPGE